ncbi:MAG: UDP-N-acetylmuramoyl-L-alanine--D-glutamate ligase [Candidatus Omnitrophica bacterium]|nr:UDP-N-acetylmuramoyl-L-alanine--D-glutamate ligase [Candidatus Omnitrophota bacterium]
MDIKGKRVCIVGAARSGIAAANLVSDLGGVVKVTDGKPLADIASALSGLKDRAGAVIEAGGHTRAFVIASDLVVASPGVWRDALPLQWAREAGIPVYGEIEFAWRHCRKPVIAVTGSNGKTTTVTLIARVIEAAGKKACLCGNVGLPFSEYARRTDVDFFVVEISSFQLELVDSFRPSIAAILNFSQNHLDRHPDMSDYFAAKQRIFMNQTAADVAVLNARDPLVYSLRDQVRAQVRVFNKDGESENPNQLAVLEVARALGIPDTVTQKVFADFTGVEHRLERVRVLDGVEFINDSKSTTVEAGRWALERLRQKAVLIVGGSDKHMDYSCLRELVRSKVRVMVAFGAIRQQFKDTFADVLPVEVIDGGLDAAVACARKAALPGECVLLSPMTASFDMFNNFEHRGQVFKDIVRDF